MRQYSSHVVALACWRYRDIFSDLHARVTKTYLEALGDDKSLPTVYGGLVGMSSLLSVQSGQQYVSSSGVVIDILLSHSKNVLNRLRIKQSQIYKSNKGKEEEMIHESMCETALIGLFRKLFKIILEAIQLNDTKLSERRYVVFIIL